MRKLPRGVIGAALLAASACVGSIGDGERAGTDQQQLCGDGIDVGESPLRRITRAQYDRTVRDLLGNQAGLGTAFVADEKVGAFYSNAIAPVSELAVEDYMDAAETLAEEAVTRLDELVPCEPASGDDSCAQSFIADFGRRAYRRPLADEEIERYLALYRAGREDGAFADGIQLVIQAMLQSPHFLYHLEIGAEPDGAVAAGVHPLTPFELAARLAYFVWGSMPDAELLAAAERGELGSADQIATQVRRMLDDPRAADAIASFHIQWLALEDLESVEKDAALYPEFGPELARAMQRETELFADHVVRSGDGLLSTLLSAPFTFANAELAALYGASAPSGGDFARVELDPARRSGLLTHASLLAKHAHPNQTSPVHRGKVIRENLLCDPPPPPPATVNDQLPEVDPNVPITEQLEQHRTDPACSGCHALMDPIGTGFEAFDAIGGYRTKIGDTSVDDRGEFVKTKDIDGPFEGVHEMAQRLAESEQVRQCVAKQWLRFAIGRLEQDEDACSEDAIQERFAGGGYDIRELIVAVAVSETMRYLRVPEETSP